MYRVISCLALLLAVAPEAAAGAPDGEHSVLVVVATDDPLAAAVEKAAHEAVTRQPWSTSVKDRSASTELAGCAENMSESCVARVVAKVGVDAIMLISMHRSTSDDGEPRIVLDGILIDSDTSEIVATTERHCLRCHDRARLSALASDLAADLIRKRGAALAPNTRIRVTTDPPDAIIRLDGKRVGPAGTAYHVAPGSIEVRTELDGYEPTVSTVRVRPNYEVLVHFDLVPERRPTRGADRDRPIARAALPWALIGGGLASGARGVTWIASYRPPIKDGVREPQVRKWDPRVPGYLATGAGVALIGAGVVILVLDRRDDRTLAIEPMGDGAMVMWGGSF